MIAIYLSPIYLLLNLYILRWAYLWMGTCHSILRTLGFRLIFAVIYVLLSTSLLTGFLIKNPKSLHRMLKITGNYFLGIFLYTLVIILLADFGRILLKYVFHASWIHSRTAFTVTGAICALLILLLSACGIFHAKYIKTTSYDVIINKTIPAFSMPENWYVRSINRNLIWYVLQGIFLIMNTMRFETRKNLKKLFVA